MLACLHVDRNAIAEHSGSWWKGTYVSGTEYRIVIRHKFTIALDQHTVVSGDHTVVSTLCNVWGITTQESGPAGDRPLR